jgi:hypothetical protein
MRESRGERAAVPDLHEILEPWVLGWAAIDHPLGGEAARDAAELAYSNRSQPQRAFFESPKDLHRGRQVSKRWRWRAWLPRGTCI